MEYFNKHTKIEKLLHKLAFSSWYPRVALADIESRIYKTQLSTVSVERPVFITALPRAGTTLLLEMLVGIGEFASHTYSDMPFLLTPLLWHQFSKSFREVSDIKERVHGDGILVNVNSPESFEEILWKEFWPSHYKKNRIIPWSEVKYPEFKNFFIEHMRKIILLRGKENEHKRYISKNNLNIARIEYLASIFPDSTIIILFRSPIQHASSLLRQHQNFLRIHKKDSFAKKYMQDTGHYDFGENLRPIDFSGWHSKGQPSDPNTILFWLRYWINAYQYLLQSSNEQVYFFSYDLLCENPIIGLEKLGEILEVKNLEQMLENIGRIAPPKPYIVDVDLIPVKTLDLAEDVFSNLNKAANFN